MQRQPSGSERAGKWSETYAATFRTKAVTLPLERPPTLLPTELISVHYECLQASLIF